MRTIQYIHAHILHRIVPRETTRRRTISKRMEHPKSITPTVKLITRMPWDVKTKVLVPVKHRRVDRTIEKGKNGVGTRRYQDGFNVRHNEIMVGLKNGTCRHGRVVNHHGLFVVVDWLDFVPSRSGHEKQVGTCAVQHWAVLWGATAVVDAERVVYCDGAT